MGRHFLDYDQARQLADAAHPGRNPNLINVPLTRTQMRLLAAGKTIYLYGPPHHEAINGVQQPTVSTIAMVRPPRRTRKHKHAHRR